MEQLGKYVWSGTYSTSWECYSESQSFCECGYCGKEYKNYKRQGSGEIVKRFVVEEVYENPPECLVYMNLEFKYTNRELISPEESYYEQGMEYLQSIGYGEEKYAYRIKDLKPDDSDWGEFAYWNKWYRSKDYLYAINFADQNGYDIEHNLQIALAENFFKYELQKQPTKMVCVVERGE